MFLEIFVLELDKELICNIDHLIDLDMLFDILEMFKHSCKVIVDDDILAGHDNGDGEEIYILQMVIR